MLSFNLNTFKTIYITDLQIPNINTKVKPLNSVRKILELVNNSIIIENFIYKFLQIARAIF